MISEKCWPKLTAFRLDIWMVTDMQSEQSIQNEILVHLSKSGYTVFRTNAGKVRTDSGGVIKLLPKGHFDIYGYNPNDQTVFYIEVKNEKGKARPEQISFHKKLTKDNVVHGIARSKEQALKIVEEKLVGYGF